MEAVCSRRPLLDFALTLAQYAARSIIQRPCGLDRTGGDRLISKSKKTKRGLVGTRGLCWCEVGNYDCFHVERPTG